jgi:hypothetical protein
MALTDKMPNNLLRRTQTAEPNFGQPGLTARVWLGTAILKYVHFQELSIENKNWLVGVVVFVVGAYRSSR